MPYGETTDPKTEAIVTRVINAIFRVHNTLGPGLLESVYEKCLILELRHEGLSVLSQVFVPITYRGEKIEPGLRLDLLVQACVVVEIKAVEVMHPVFQAQLLTYLKLSEIRVGILCNFNVPLIKDGIKRVIY